MRSNGANVGMGTIRWTALEASQSALCSVEAKLGRLEHLRSDVGAIFQAGTAANPLLLQQLPVIRQLPTDTGGRVASIELTTCCLRFRIDGRGTCPACPNQDPSERTRRMAESAMLYGQDAPRVTPGHSGPAQTIPSRPCENVYRFHNGNCV